MRLGYRPALDGLRGISILAVLAYHSGLLRGGWAGVDIFFTLSGFLITTLLLDELDTTGCVSLAKFYARRALRLLPALAALLAIWGVVLIVESPAFLWVTLSYIAAVLFYIANWAVIAGLPLGIFGHAWSLAIEEQFYLLWPVVLLWLVRRSPNRATIAWVILAMACAATVWRFGLASEGASFTRRFLGLDTRADSLLIGCALGVGVSAGLVERFGRLATAAGGGALIVLLVVFVMAPPLTGFAAGCSSVAATVTALIIAAALLPRSVVQQLLEVPVLVHIGRISYGLYLWHFPVFFSVGALSPEGVTVASGRTIALGWTLSFAAALVSFVIVERPALRLKPRPARSEAWAGVGGGTLTR